MSRRADFALAKFAGIILGLLVLSGLFFVVKAGNKVIFGGENDRRNHWELMGLHLQGIIENPAAEVKRDFLFNYDLHKDGEAFSGAIFGLSTDGRFTAILPPVPGSPTTAEETNAWLMREDKRPVDWLPQKYSKVCEERACLCLSDFPFRKQAAEGTNGLEIIQHAEVCRLLGKEDQKIILDFQSLQEEMAGQGWLAWSGELLWESDRRYPTIVMQKDDCGKVKDRDSDTNGAICVFAAAIVQEE